MSHLVPAGNSCFYITAEYSEWVWPCGIYRFIGVWTVLVMHLHTAMNCNEAGIHCSINKFAPLHLFTTNIYIHTITSTSVFGFIHSNYF